MNDKFKEKLSQIITGAMDEYYQHLLIMGTKNPTPPYHAGQEALRAIWPTIDEYMDRVRQEAWSEGYSDGIHYADDSRITDV